MDFTYSELANVCKILAIGAHGELVQTLGGLAGASKQPRTGRAGESPVLEVRTHDLTYQAVATVARDQQAGTPYGVAVVEIQPATEALAEQLVRALYHTDLRLQILVLLAPAAFPGRAITEGMNSCDRVACLRLPCEGDYLTQLVKLLSAKWLREKWLEEWKQRAAAASAVTTAAKPSDKELNLTAIGTLASGIAHEFNNFLTVIQSQMDLAMERARHLPEVMRLLTGVMQTARSAAHLSRKLVSMTPEAQSSPEAVRLDELIDAEVAMLRKTLGEEMVLKTDHQRGLPAVWADPGTVGQIMMNIAVHAKAGMPQGGVLQFSTSSVEVADGTFVRRQFPEVAQGKYVHVMVEDPNPESAAGGEAADMASHERLRWLKETLAECGGAFSAGIVPGVTRLYQMLFPLARQEAGSSAVKSGPDHEAAPATILVVDDDETICSVMTQVLTSARHRVLTAGSADAGWTQWRQHRGTIRLLITDINMPGGANGVALGKAVQEEDGSVPVIYTSGYRASAQVGNLVAGANYLPKPFGMTDLLSVVSHNLNLYRRHGLD